jgi:hypothetical protein
MRSVCLASMLTLFGLAAAVPVWLSAAPPVSEKLPTKDLKKSAQVRADLPDEELLPPINVQVRSTKGNVGQILMGDRQVDTLQILRGEIMSMVGNTEPSSEEDGFELKIMAQDDLKMGELLRVIDHVAGYRDRNGNQRILMRKYWLAEPYTLNQADAKKMPHLDRKFRLIKIVGGS